MVDSPVHSNVPMEISPSVGAEQDAPNKQCFSQIQTRKFWAPLLPPACRLCPSMDLVVLGMQAPANASATSSLWLHRTVSWQRLSSVTNLETQEGAQGNVTAIAWSPDGRFLAVALSDGEVALYHVEAMVSSPTSMTEEPSSQGLLCKIPVEDDGIVGLTWAHVGRNHPSWNWTGAQKEAEVSWNYRSHYLDRSADLLPPSEHHSQEHHRAEGKHSIISTLPTCKKPLSLLCVATKGKGLHLYAHGRYRILTLPMITQRAGNVVCSSDLVHFLVHQEKSMNLSLFSIPALSRYRYHLQTISSLNCSISSHLEAIREHASEIVASWKVSIKPLDMKLEGLVKLLNNYGVQGDLRSVLVQYILVGHTSVSSDLSNAIDQFFTGVQMNDQLLTRMERSLQGAVANVETATRTGLLSPARALVFHAGELLGLARYASFLISEKSAQNIHDCCAILLVSVEYTLAQLIEARFRLRDFVAWLRSAGSEVKARGTAANSAQRENAKKRRVPQATVERMLAYLQKEEYESSSLTESILGIPLTELLHETPAFVRSRAPSPSTVLEHNLAARVLDRKTPTVLHAAKQTEVATEKGFEEPRSLLSRSVQRTDLFLPVQVQTEFHPVAIHTRVGRDGRSRSDEDGGGEDDEMSGLLVPKLASGKPLPEIPSIHCRQWSIIAKTASSTSLDTPDCFGIQLYLIPHDWTDLEAGCDDYEELLEYCDHIEDANSSGGTPFYLTAELVLPPNHLVLDVAFYGDDGKSSLSSGVDRGAGREGRQALGLLVGTEETINLWLLKYDNVAFQLVPAKNQYSKQIFLDGASGIESPVVVQPLSEAQGEDEEEEDGVVYAKTRRICTFDSQASANATARLMLSGSRGIGGVFSTIQGVTTLELLDLEEDEEEDEEDGDEDTENQSMEG